MDHMEIREPVDKRAHYTTFAGETLQGYFDELPITRVVGETRGELGLQDDSHHIVRESSFVPAQVVFHADVLENLASLRDHARHLRVPAVSMHFVFVMCHARALNEAHSKVLGFTNTFDALRDEYAIALGRNYLVVSVSEIEDTNCYGICFASVS